MADNLHIAAASFFALPDHAVVTLEGPDASAFAQAQFANDVAALAAGHWHWNAWLTPKGRVIALFALLKVAPDHLLLVVPDTDAAAMVEQLRRFVFRRKLKIAQSHWQAHGAWTKPCVATAGDIDAADNRLELDYGTPASPRTLRLSVETAGHDLYQHDLYEHDLHQHDLHQQARWRAQDLRYGLPRLPASQREQWTPQQLSLDRLNAFSVKKGCYPGQEIVARTHFLGKAKRGLVLLESAAAVGDGDPVLADGAALGEIVCSGQDGMHLALAVLPLDRDPVPLTANGTALREVPLSDGLAR